jgi:hypothetical protein
MVMVSNPRACHRARDTRRTDMTTRSPRTILAFSAAMALTVAALAPTAALAKGPNGDGSGTCDGDCTSDTPQAQVQARDGSGSQAQNDDRNATQARNSNAARNVQSNAATNTRSNRNLNANRNTNTTTKANGNGQNAKQNARTGAGQGPNEDGQRGPGTCDDCAAEMGVLSDEQKDGLLYMAEEEKLAHDIYAAFADQYGVPIFSNIAESEATHQAAVAVAIERYGLADLDLPTAAGVFESEPLNLLYGSLLAEGSTSLEAAIGVGVQIEELDIADLETRMAALQTSEPGVYSAPDVYELYSHLLAGSENHLEAFQGWQ